MDTLGRISKQLDNLESTFGLERGEYVYPPPGAEHCAKGVEIYCAKQGTVHTRKEKINLVERFCDEDFCREDADWQKCMGLQKRTAANEYGYRRFSARESGKCTSFPSEFCADAGAFYERGEAADENSGAVSISMTAGECAKWSVKR